VQQIVAQICLVKKFAQFQEALSV